MNALGLLTPVVKEEEAAEVPSPSPTPAPALNKSPSKKKSSSTSINVHNGVPSSASSSATAAMAAVAEGGGHRGSGSGDQRCVRGVHGDLSGGAANEERWGFGSGYDPFEPGGSSQEREGYIQRQEEERREDAYRAGIIQAEEICVALAARRLHHSPRQRRDGSRRDIGWGVTETRVWAGELRLEHLEQPCNN
jgi:hypothetical protein